MVASCERPLLQKQDVLKMQKENSWTQRAQPKTEVKFELPLVLWNRLLCISRDEGKTLDAVIERFLRTGLQSEGKI